MFIELKNLFKKNFKHTEKLQVWYNELPYAIHTVLSTVDIVTTFLLSLLNAYILLYFCSELFASQF